MLELTKYLRANSNSIEKLKEEFAINSKQHSVYPNLFTFKYSQIDSPMDKKIVQEARGVILDQNNDWNVVAIGYDKFFNYGEGFASEIDWGSAKVLNKLDGSLMLMYYYDNRWNVATSGTPDAKAKVGDWDISFEELFWKVFQDKNYKLPLDEFRGLTFCFELMTKYNRVVVNHEADNLVLHGIRSSIDLSEYNHYSIKSIASLMGYEVVQTYPIGSLQEIIECSKKLNPMEQEGYVVVDDNFNRIKIKSPQYVALHHCISKSSNKYMMQIIITNECDEFLSYFPEHKETYEELKYKFNSLVENLEKLYIKFKDIPNSKDFALKVKEIPFNQALFAMRNNKCSSVKEYIQNQINFKGLACISDSILKLLK